MLLVRTFRGEQIICFFLNLQFPESPEMGARVKLIMNDGGAAEKLVAESDLKLLVTGRGEDAQLLAV